MIMQVGLRIERAGVRIRDSRVGEPALLPQAIGDARREPAAAQDEVAGDQGRIVGIVSFIGHGEAGEVDGVGLVGGRDRLAPRLEVGLEGSFDPRVGLAAFQPSKRLGEDRQDFRGLEVADDHELAVVGAEVVVIERADLVEGRLLEPLDLLVDGRHVPDVVAGIGGQQALEVVEALAHRVGAALLEAGDQLVLHHLELAVRQGRLAEDLAKDLENSGEVGALGLDGES